VAVVLPIDAVMVAVPADTAVTLPLATVAIAGAELVQVIVAAGHVDGVRVALMFAVNGTAMVNVAGLSVIAVTHGGTVTMALPCTLLTVAVIVLVPAAKAVTRPLLDTVATVWLELDQLGVSAPQFCCAIVAATVVVCAIGSVTVPGLTVTADTVHVAGGVGLLPVSEPQAAVTSRRQRLRRTRVFTWAP
jgi:hypothetical protein